MTGQQMIEKSEILLGYTASNGNLQLSARITGKALMIVNQVYSDLWRICYDEAFIPLENIHSEIALPERVLNDVMPYGVAMFIAQSESDGEQQQMYSFLYNKKRAGLNRKEQIIDVMPRSCDI